MYKFIYFYSIFWNTLNKERFCSEDEPRGDYGLQIKGDDDQTYQTLEQVMQRKYFACLHMSNSHLGYLGPWWGDYELLSTSYICVSKFNWE